MLYRMYECDASESATEDRGVQNVRERRGCTNVLLRNSRGIVRPPACAGYAISTLQAPKLDRLLDLSLMGRAKFFLLLFVVAMLAMIFAALNTQTVAIELALLNIKLSLGMALIIAAAVGVIGGVLMRGLWMAELLAERGRLRRALKAAEASARAQAAGREPPRDPVS